jgi:hypothetical protein
MNWQRLGFAFIWFGNVLMANTVIFGNTYIKAPNYKGGNFYFRAQYVCKYDQNMFMYVIGSVRLLRIRIVEKLEILEV